MLRFSTGEIRAMSSKTVPLIILDLKSIIQI